MICTSPRSGSTLLCTLLRATRVAGWPESWLYGPSIGDWAKRMELPEDTPFRDIVAGVLDKGRAGGSVFGLRQQWPSFPLLCSTLERERPETTARGRLEGALGPLRYVYLKREDKVEQAVSLIRANQTGIWHRNADGSIYERKDPSGEDGFDANAIEEQARQLTCYDECWSAWFDAEKITPLRLTYDDLSSNPNGTLALVLDWIGIDPSHANGITAPTRRLADAKSKDWVRRVKTG